MRTRFRAAGIAAALLLAGSIPGGTATATEQAPCDYQDAAGHCSAYFVTTFPLCQNYVPDYGTSAMRQACWLYGQHYYRQAFRAINGGAYEWVGHGH